MLAGNANPWHNVANPLDVNNDGLFTPNDIVVSVNSIHRYGIGRLGESLGALIHSGSTQGGASEGEDGSEAIRDPKVMVDVNNDNLLTPLDAARLVNAYNAGEGEPGMVRASVRMTTNVPLRYEDLGGVTIQRPVIDYPEATWPTRQDVTTVTPGETVLLNVFVQDIRPDDGSNNFGVFAAYFDLAYDPAAFSIPAGASNNPQEAFSFPVNFGNAKHQQTFGTPPNQTKTEDYNYPNGSSGDASTPGLIDELGGFANYPSSLYGRTLPNVPEAKRDVFLVAHVLDVPFTVQSFVVQNDQYDVQEGQPATLSVLENDAKIGSATGVSYAFNIGPAQGTGHDFLVYTDPEENSAVPSDQIDFVHDGLTVVNTRTLTTSIFQAPTKGTVTPGLNNTFIYTPTVQGPDTDTFVYTVSDGVTSKQATVTVNIGSVNDPPVITVPAGQTTNEDTDKTFAGGAISVADPDASDGQLLVTVNVPNAAAGTFSLGNPASGVTFTAGDGTRDTQMTFTGNLTQINNAFGAATFHPALNYNGPASVVITVNDQGNTGELGGPKSDTKNLTISVTPDNDPPVNTVPGAQTVPNNAAFVFSAPNGNLISIADADGDVNVQTDLSVTAGSLAVKPGGGATITAPNAMSVRIAGTVSQVNDALSQVTFTPPVETSPGFIGEVTLTVLTSDLGNTGSGNVLTDEDPVTLNVVPPRQPFAANDSATVAEGSQDNPIDVLGNDIPTAGGTLTITKLNGQDVALQPIATTHGTVTTDGTDVTYTPADNYFGNDSFTYTIEAAPDAGQGEHTGTVNVLVTPVNDPPELTIPFAQITTNEDIPVLIVNGGSMTVADLDADSGGGVKVTASVSHGTLHAPNGTVVVGGADTGTLSITGLIAAVNASLAGLTYTPAEDYFGADTLQVLVDDMGNTGGGSLTDSGSVPITVNPVNDAPTIKAPVQAATKQDVPITFTQGTATEISIADVDSATLTVGLVLQPDPLKPAADSGNLVLGTTAGVTVTGGADNSNAVTFTGTRAAVNAALNGLRYDVLPGYEGMPSLQITASDGEFTPAVTVGLIVSGINDPPVNVLPAGPVVVAEDNDLVFNGNLQVSDPDAGAVANIEVTLSATNGVLTPVATPGVTVAPVASGIKLTGSIPNINQALNGLKFRPDQDYHGPAQLVIATNDKGNTGDPPAPGQTELTDTDTVPITVTPSNDPPVANDDGSPTDRTTVLWNTVGNEFDVLANDNNGPDAGEPLETLVITEVDITNAHGTVAIQDGKLLYTPAAGYTGNAEIVYTVNDRADLTGLTDTATVYIVVVDYVPSDVSGHVFFDFDDDGRMDPGEWGIGGVQVTLSGWNIQGKYEERTAWTDGTGKYTFHDVLPSQLESPYTLTEHQPISIADGKDTPGQAATWKANDQFEIALPVFGFADPTVAFHNDFGELGFRPEFGGLALWDLIHSGQAGTGGPIGGMLFGADALGNLQWYIDLGGWSGYVPGQPLSNGFAVTTQDGKLPMTDSHSAAIRELDATDEAIRTMYNRSGGWMTRIDGEANDFGLPLYQSAAVVAGEGEAISEVSDAELLAANGSYEAAVDAVLAGIA